MTFLFSLIVLLTKLNLSIIIKTQVIKMQINLNQFKQHQVLYVNILFTFLCIFFPLSLGMEIAWFLMWILIPLFMQTDKAFHCLTYMSLYMRILHSVKLFSIIICVSFFVVLIKELLFLNKNKLLNKFFKILFCYLALIILPLFYSVLINKTVNILFIYYLNMINLLFLFYLLKNKLNQNIILTYCYGIIISSILSLACFSGGLHLFPFNGNRFCAFMPLCNSLGVSCVICISLIYLMFINNQIKQIHAIPLMLILSFIGLTTLSKNFLITFTILLLVILITQFKSSGNKKKFLQMFLIIFISLCPFLLYYGSIMFERFFSDNGYSNMFDIITTGRLDKWKLYIKPWAKHFYSIVFGLGLGVDFNTPYSSHSFYIGYLSKMGIIGIAAIVAFVYFIVFEKNKIKLKLKYLPVILLLLICLAEDMSFNTFNFVPVIISFMLFNQDNNK